MVGTALQVAQCNLDHVLNLASLNNTHFNSAACEDMQGGTKNEGHVNKTRQHILENHDWKGHRGHGRNRGSINSRPIKKWVCGLLSGCLAKDVPWLHCLMGLAQSRKGRATLRGAEYPEES